MRESICSF